MEYQDRQANFITPKSLASDIDTASEARDIVQLITLRSNGQFNTTIYSYDDRFRGIFGSRNVVLMHANDIDRFGLKEGSLVTRRSKTASIAASAGFGWCAMISRRDASPATIRNAIHCCHCGIMVKRVEHRPRNRFPCV
jgi:hypothetical protein